MKKEHTFDRTKKIVLKLNTWPLELRSSKIRKIDVQKVKISKFVEKYKNINQNAAQRIKQK